MLIDCDTCAVRDIALPRLRGDCDPEQSRAQLGRARRRANSDALGSLAAAGLVPPLRLVPLVVTPPPAHAGQLRSP